MTPKLKVIKGTFLSSYFLPSSQNYYSSIYKTVGVEKQLETSTRLTLKKPFSAEMQRHICKMSGSKDLLKDFFWFLLLLVLVVEARACECSTLSYTFSL